MHTLTQLEKQQVGLRLPKYLLDEIDDFTKSYSLNRSEIIVEAIKSYVSEQKAKIFYDEFDSSAKELKSVLQNKESIDNLQTLDELIDELENS
ncbi:MAG: ribbon-helix-helix domain-containing protein [Sulfurimonas sp.]|nr:ribbon-helix-helix domain-containing protein [Sulfurimonas sp.]